jgi:hypothetical protein
MSKKQQSQAVPEKARVPAQPWPWILLALNPLLITGGVFHPDPYIKTIFIAAVLGLTLLAYPWRPANQTTLRFSIPELLWLGYLVWGGVAILWSDTATIAFERLVYLLLPTAGYVVARQTQFWRSALFWNVFTAVALVVSIIGICMYLFAGTPLGFDWILSAGRPSSTLSYRAYAATYLVLTLPFLVWRMFSRQTRSMGQFVFAALSFATTLVFLVYTRARSEWIGAIAALGVMGALALVQKRRPQTTFLPVLGGVAVCTVVMMFLSPATSMLESDSQRQKLEGTGKESLSGTLESTLDIVRSGGGDRAVLWGMASDIAFDTTLQGRYEGPLGTPRWIFGIGLGQFPIETAKYGHVSYILGTEVHNDWFQAFLELGPLGFLLLAGFAVSLLVYAWKARDKGLVLAALGGLLAWIFSTQADFLTPRVFATLWIAAIAAIIHGEAGVASVVQLKAGPDLRATGRKMWGLALLWVVYAYGITMSIDGTIYTALLNHDRPLAEVVDESVPSYERGMGKFLLFTGFSQLSSTLASMNTSDPVLYQLQEKMSLALLSMHPYNMEALLRLRDVYAQTKDYGRFLDVNDRYMRLRPLEPEPWRLKGEALILQRDTAAALGALQKAAELDPQSTAVARRIIELEVIRGNRKGAVELMGKYLSSHADDITMRLYKSQTELALGDSLSAARSAYAAIRQDTTSADARQFWMVRISDTFRRQVMQER